MVKEKEKSRGMFEKNDSKKSVKKMKEFESNLYVRESEGKVNEKK